MLDLLAKELSIHGVSLSPKGLVKMEKGEVPVGHATSLYKVKARSAYNISEKLWGEIKDLLSKPNPQQSQPPEGIENIFVHCLQSLKRMIYLYPGLADFESIEKALCKALCTDINDFSYRTMSKIIEYKLAIEWVGHIIAKNLYIRYLLILYSKVITNKQVVTAKGVHGPYANLDMPMQERVFEWSAISDEVHEREKDKQHQSRYTMGLEGYNDPYVNEGFVWRELKNEPFLWGKEGENPYPHRNLLWS